MAVSRTSSGRPKENAARFALNAGTSVRGMVKLSIATGTVVQKIYVQEMSIGS